MARLTRFVVAVLVAVGGTALSIWLERLQVPMWLLAATGIVSFTLAAGIAWWPRWRAAGRAFVHPNETIETIAAPIQQRALDQAPSEITWHFDEPNQNFLGMSASWGSEAYVLNFMATARNHTGQRITDFGAYIEFGRTGQRHQLYVNIDGGHLVDPSETTGIQAGGSVQLVSKPFPSDRPERSEGVTRSRFIAEVMSIQFVFTFNGKRITRDFFSAQDVQDLLERFENARLATNVTFAPQVLLRP